MTRNLVAEGEESHRHRLVFGELSIPVLLTILDAVGVRSGDHFLDIGSGDGALVLGAALHYQDYLKFLGHRSCAATGRENKTAQGFFEGQHSNVSPRMGLSVGASQICPWQCLQCSDRSRFTNLLSETTLVVGFVTTWSASNASEETRTSLANRMLPELSQALSLGSDIGVGGRQARCLKGRISMGSQLSNTYSAPTLLLSLLPLCTQGHDGGRNSARRK